MRVFTKLHLLALCTVVRQRIRWGDRFYARHMRCSL